MVLTCDPPWRYAVFVDNWLYWATMTAWCNAHIGQEDIEWSRRFTGGFGNTWLFKQQSHWLQFKLTWC